MQTARKIAETGVNSTDSLTACDIYKITNGTKQLIHNEPGKTGLAEWLHLVSTDLLGSVTPAARGNYCFMAKVSEYYTKFKAVHFISRKDKALTTLVDFV